MKISPGKVPAGDVLIYEYGVRLDKECLEAANDQVMKARRLYNDLVACIRDIVGQMNEFVLQSAPAEARQLQQRIDELNAQFDEARARNDEDAMKAVAQQRRELWPKLWDALAKTRKALRSELSSRFLSRIGKNSRCETYQLRCRAVDDGLGWATANAVLDAALQAFSKSIVKGRAPRFSVGADKVQDTLTLQFVAAGGVASAALLEEKHGELSILPTQGCGRRKYGELRFRLGSAKANTYATGTWQYHRPLPTGSYVGIARLVRRRIGKDDKWALQLMVKLPEPLDERVAGRAPLVAVHMGWAADVSGRRVAGIADSADPGLARLIQLPPRIEEGLARAAKIASERDVARDAIVPLVKEMPLGENWPEELVEEIKAIRRLPPQHVAIRRLHRLCRALSAHDSNPEWLEQWRKDDRLRWQAAAHGARRARNARKDFYRGLAIDLARNYDAIVIEPLDLAGAAKKIDENTGERSEFARKARAGRTVAALYELESAIRWAAAKNGTAVLDLTAETATCCAMCGGTAAHSVENSQELACDSCGAQLDRKLNGAAIAWTLANDQREDAVADFWISAHAEREGQAAKRRERLERIAAARKVAREASEENSSEGSAQEENQCDTVATPCDEHD